MSVNRIIISTFSFQPHFSRCQPSSHGLGECWVQSWSLSWGCSHRVRKKSCFLQLWHGHFHLRRGQCNHHNLLFCITSAFWSFPSEHHCYIISVLNGSLPAIYFKKLTNSRLWNLADMLACLRSVFLQKTGAHSHSDSWPPSHLCLHSWGNHQKTGWKTEAREEDKNLSVKLSGLQLSASTFHVLFLTYSTSSEPEDINILYL